MVFFSSKVLIDKLSIYDNIIMEVVMGFRIKQYAHEQGMKLGELARRLRMPLSNLSAISSGRRSVSVRLLSRIAGLLSCGVSELFEDDPGPDSVLKKGPLAQALREIEAANPLGIEKGWTHRLSLIRERHFKSVREPDASYGSDINKKGDPHEILIDRFNRTGVAYVVIGMSAINYYAPSASESFGTQDYDIFLRPSLSNVAKALRIFRELGYETMTTDGAIHDKDLGQLLRKKKTLFAIDPYRLKFDLVLAVSGFIFRQMADDASIFKAGETLIRVAKLNKLLASKEAAGRPKDRLFLKRYQMLLKKMPKNPGS